MCNSRPICDTRGEVECSVHALAKNKVSENAIQFEDSTDLIEYLLGTAILCKPGMKSVITSSGSIFSKN